VLNKTGPQSIHILRGVRQQQDEPGRFSICSRQAAVVPGKISAVSELSDTDAIEYGMVKFIADSISSKL
ncbi:hypothetical protein WDK40_23000, partial [Escherichia coli]